MEVKKKNQKKMNILKFNWGYAVAFLYVGFALAMLFLVYKCTEHPVDLVSADYYDKEIKFQQQYDKEQNASLLLNPLQLSVNSDSQTVVINFPTAENSSVLKGSIYFMRPDNSTSDKTIAIAANSNHEQIVDYSTWKKGLYRIEVSWNDGVKEYFKQSFIKLN